MLSLFSSWSRLMARHPRLTGLMVFLLVATAFLGWWAASWAGHRSDRLAAEAALAGYDYAEARRRLGLCIERRPLDPGLRLLAARAARGEGDLEAAEEHLSVLRGLPDTGGPDATLERALLLAQRGKVPEVLNYLADAVDLRHPRSAAILESLAKGCLQVYQLERVMFWLEELLAREPKHAGGRLLLAQSVETRGNRTKAVAMLQEVVAEYPRYYQARLALADLQFKAGMFREAAAEYAVLAEQRPEAYLPALGLASSYSRMREDDNARPLLKRLLERHPEDPEVLHECGRLALNENRLAEAEPLLRRAAELSPQDSQAHRSLGVCFSRLGKDNESRRYLNRAKALEDDLILLEKTVTEIGRAPNDPAPRREAGRICLRNGHYAEALRWLTGSLDIAPKDKPTHLLLAEYYNARGDAERAKQHQRKALGP